MPRRYILLTPEDGPLWRLAAAVARQDVTAPLDPPAQRAPAKAHGGRASFAGLARRLCAKEAGEREVDIAQMSEILADLRELLAADPKAVVEVLAGKIVEA